MTITGLGWWQAGRCLSAITVQLLSFCTFASSYVFRRLFLFLAFLVMLFLGFIYLLSWRSLSVTAWIYANYHHLI
jgi:hypothetical protein